MLWREPSPKPTAEGRQDAKTLKAPVVSKPKLNDQGLRWLSFFNFAPSYNNAMPFYFHTGLIYKGLIPGRDQDQTGVAFALGNHSYDKPEASLLIIAVLWEVADFVGFCRIAVTIYAVGIGEHTRLACACPASSQNRFCNEAADIAAVVFAMMAGASSCASFICV